MAVIWTSKTGGKAYAPRRPNKVKWSSPLAEDLAHLFWPEAPGHYRDLVTGQTIPSSSSNPLTYMDGVPLRRVDTGDSYASGSAQFDSDVGSASDTVGRSTLGWARMPDMDLDRNNRRYLILAERQSGADRDYRVSLLPHDGSASSRGIWFEYKFGTSGSVLYTQTEHGVAFSETNASLIGTTHDTTTASIYYNGLLGDTGTGGSGNDTGPIDTITIGSGIDFAVGPCFIYYVPLTAEQNWRLFSPQSRWDMVAVSTRTYFLPTAAAAVAPVIWTSRTRGLSQRAPSQVTGVNWASPLARNLLCVIPGYGTHWNRDLVSGQLQAYGSADKSALSSRTIDALVADGTGGDPSSHLIGIDNVKVPADGSPGSLISHNVFSTASLGSYAGMGHYGANAFTGGFRFGIHTFKSTDDSLSCWVGDGTGGGSADRRGRGAVPGGVSANTEYQVITAVDGVLSATCLDVYVNSVASTESMSGSSTLDVDWGVKAMLGGYNASSFDFGIYGHSWSFCGVGHRIGDEEAQAWYSHPYDIYRTITRTHFLPGAAAGSVIWSRRGRLNV